MHAFTVTIPDYAKECRRKLSLPVEEDTSLPLSPALRKSLSPGTAFTFTLDEAISAGDRFLAIHGRPPNAVQVLSDWVNMLRWEFSTYWESPAGDWYSVRENGPTIFSAEHPKRSGELLAHGIAILFLERRLQLARSRFFFLEGAKARPDFLVRLERSAQRAVLLRDRKKMGLEVRSRYRVQVVPKGDKPKLKAKKNAIANTVAIYCAYGPPTDVRKEPRTRILLADPEGESDPSDPAEVMTILLGHYLGVTGRLGLWDERDFLAAILDAAEEHRPLPPPLRTHRPAGAFGLPREVVRGRRYVGRVFSELLVRREQGLLTDEEAALAIDTGRLGRVFFAGIREDVLDAVVGLDLEAIEGFFDDLALGEGQVDEFFASDGTVRVEYEQATRESIFGRAIADALRVRRG